MADKRMFSKKVIDSDIFLDMPMSTQCLYFHLCMRADDDGFVDNPKKITRLVGGSEDDLKILLMKNFIIGFENGVIVIKHWRLHNWLRSDHYTPTIYQKEKEILELNDQKIYEPKGQLPNGSQMVTKQLPNGRTEENRREEKRIEENSKEECIGAKPKTHTFTPPALDEVTAYCIERNNNVDPQRFVDFYQAKGWYVGKNKMKDWKAAVRTWEKEEKPKGETIEEMMKRYGIK